MSKDQFIGTWKLVSYETRRSDGTVAYPLGEQAVGRITYNEQGEMAAQLMRAGVPKFAGGDRTKGTPEEINAAFQGYIAYWGSYSIDPEKNIVTHYPEGCFDPNQVGVPQMRFYELTAKRLVLSTEPRPVKGGTITGYLTWERIE